MTRLTGLVRIVVMSLVMALVSGLMAGSIAPPRAAAQAADGRYIVVLRDDAGDPDAAAAELAKQHGLGVSHVYHYVLKGFAASVPAAAVQGLLHNPKVAYIDLDRPVFAVQDAQAMRTVGSATLPTGVDRAGAEAPGAGAAVAVLDSGIAPHGDLNIAGGYNCTSADASAYGDVYGHGTHVAGIIGANGKILGVAPGTPLWSVKVLGDTGSGQWSWVICGIDWAAGRGLTVGNMSLSGASSESATGCTNSSLHQAICNARTKGLQFAVAAGNSSADAGGYVPAKYPEVTTVSALADSNGCDGGVTGAATSAGADESRASFSNFGGVVDVAAPGVDIYSTVPGGYGTKSGTSMAAPHVAGLMARGGYATTPSRWGGEAIAVLGGGDTSCLGSTTTDGTAPTAPTGLTATAPMATQVNLAWTAATDNVGVTGYTIYRNGAALTTVTGTSYSNTRVAAGTTYTYTVTAKDAAGNVSAASNAATVTTPASQPCAAPTAGQVVLYQAITYDLSNGWVCETFATADPDLRDNLVGNDTVSSVKVGPSTQVELCQAIDYGPVCETLTTDAPDLRNNPVGNDTVTSLRVGPAAPDTTAPSAPTGVVATATSATQVNLSWTAATDAVGVTGYEIYRETTSTPTVPATLLATVTTVTSYSDTTATAGTSYSYTVKAKDAAGNVSAASTAAPVTTPSAPTAPSAPTNLTAISPRGSTKVNLTWTDTATNETGYRVYRRVSGATTWSLRKDNLPVNTASFTDTNVVKGKKYDYYVAAFNAVGVTKSAIVSVVGGAGTTSTAASATNADTTPAIAEATATTTPTATAIATATPTATATGFTAGTTVVVTEDGVNLRAAPSRRADIVTTLAAGTPLTVTGQVRSKQGIDWYPVATIEGATGYVASQFLTATAPAATSSASVVGTGQAPVVAGVANASTERTDSASGSTDTSVAPESHDRISTEGSTSANTATETQPTPTATATATATVLANRVPVAEAGEDQVIEDSDGDGLAAVLLNGAASTDPDGDAVTYQWFDEAGTVLADGATPEVQLPVSSHTLTLVVADAAGATASDTVTVTVHGVRVVLAAAATLLDTTGEPVGTATFVTEPTGVVSVTIIAYGLTPGAHGLHLHETGMCDPAGEAFASAGGHVNPTQASHGAHAGDLGNLTADAVGVSQLAVTTDQFTLAQLLDADGSTVVIHADPDDGVSEPEGNSGARVACGVVTEVSPDAVATLQADAQLAATTAAEQVAAEQAAAEQAAAAPSVVDATAIDSDSDALTDAQETDIYGTNPLVLDTDGDGVSDGAEVSAGTNPLIPEAPAASADPGVSDTATANTAGSGAEPVVDPGVSEATDDAATSDIEPATDPAADLGTAPLGVDSESDGVPDATDQP